MISLICGQSELSLAIADSDWVRAEDVVQRKPQQASQWSVRHGFFEGVRDAHCLPLHEACVSAAPVETVNAILCANLDAARTRETSYRRLPLHCACRRRISQDIEVVRILVKAYPGACLIPDDLGRLPLHYALSNGSPAALVELLLSVNPKAAHGVDNRGWTPLHVACSTGLASPAIISALLTACPEAVVLHTKKGSTPIQCLHPNMPERNRIRVLLRMARQDFDKKFSNPLHRNRKTLLDENHDILLV